MKPKFIFPISLLLLHVITSCKKYDEGGKINHAEKNIIHEWHMERAWVDESETSYVAENPQIHEVTEDWVFYEDGTCKKDHDSDALFGTWKLKDKNTVLEINMASILYKYEIRKLTPGSDGEMVWEHSLGNNRYKFILTSLL